MHMTKVPTVTLHTYAYVIWLWFAIMHKTVHKYTSKHTQQQSSRAVLVIKDQLDHLLQGYKSKPLALLSSVSVSTGNEQANRQTEIITDQTIAVISFFRPPGPALPPTQFTSICVHLVDSVIQSMPE